MSRKNVLVRWLAAAALVLMAVLATISCANEPKVYTLVIKSDGEPTFRQDLVETSPWMLEEKTRPGYELESITDQHGHVYQPLDIIRINENLTITYNWGTGDYVVKTADGGLKINKYKGAETEVVIPNNIGGLPITSIGEYAFKNCTSLTSVTIPDSVTSIEGSSYYSYGAFSGCTGLKSIIIPDSVTSIGRYAFDGCTGLESVVLGNGITSLDGLSFADNMNLTSVTIGNGVTYINGRMFRGCTGLTSITIPDSVTEIGYSAFEGCTGLTSIDIPDNVTSIRSDAFDGCSGLESIVLGKNIESLSGFNFKDYVNLSSISVAKTNEVYYSSGNCLIRKEDNVLLVGCKNSVIPSNGTVKKIEDYAFSNCTDSISLDIPKNVTEIESYAFDGCGDVDLTFAEGTTKISSLGCSGTVNGYISVSIPSTVTSLDCYLGNCFTIEIDPENIVYRSGGNCVIRREDNVLVAGCSNSTIPSGVTSIGGYAFSGCTSLDSITIPDSVTSIGYSAFYNCTSLTSINIPDSVTSIGYWAFKDCTGLTSINIPDNVTSIGEGAFCGCTGLTSIEIPGSVTDIGGGAFAYCSNLKSISVDSNNSVYLSSGDCLYSKKGNLVLALNKSSIHIPDCVTNIGSSAFEGCTSLTSINIPNNVTNIGSSAFEGCTGLTSIDIPNNVTSIGGGAFEGCTGLTSISIPSSVTSIGGWAFENCTGLTSITIPNGVTSIDHNAFENCTGLTSITIPSSVTSVSWYAFWNWTSSQTINIDKTEAEVNAQWDSDWKGWCDATIIYKDSPAN